MKLRVRGNSLRLRLKRGEVDLLAAGESIVEETHFPGATLGYRVDVTRDDAVRANLDSNNVVIRLPASIISTWASTDEVSIFAAQDLPGGDKLSLLIEKEFSCLEPGHGRDCEDDTDTFPHPRAEAHHA